MRRFFALAFCIASAGAAVQPAAPQPLTALYAAALRDFNPRLDTRTSMILAARVIAEADARALDARLLVALVAVESGWHLHAVSSAGAVGLGQLMPATAAQLGVDPADPQENIHGVAVHLRMLLNHYARYDLQTRYVLTIGAYNAGSGAIERYGGLPPYPQTQRYVRTVIALWRRLAGFGAP